MIWLLVELQLDVVSSYDQVLVVAQVQHSTMWRTKAVRAGTIWTVAVASLSVKQKKAANKPRIELVSSEHLLLEQKGVRRRLLQLLEYSKLPGLKNKVSSQP